jgi:hypothetical protein
MRDKPDLSVFLNIQWDDCSESVSGPGSTLAATASLRQGLDSALRSLKIRSLVDAPCGDMNWMRQFHYPFDKYIGVDIVPHLIERLTEDTFPTAYHFQVGNIVTDVLPAADALLCRDCLVHLPFNAIHEAQRLWTLADFRYILATTFHAHQSNVDCDPGEWRPLNMAIAPFYWREPHMLIPDADDLAGPLFQDKSIGIWKLSDLQPI